MKIPNEKEIFKLFANNIVCSQIAKLFRAKSIIKESISISKREKLMSSITFLLNGMSLILIWKLFTKREREEASKKCEFGRYKK